MQKCIPFLVLMLLPPVWGFFGHRMINRLSVYTLPEPLFNYYKSKVSYLEEHAVDPDKRRYAVKGEAECHFIDLDQYGANRDSIKAALPTKWKEAVAKFGEASLRQHGIGPWNTYWTYLKLVRAFENQDTDAILKYSAELGHYVGDMHVPLHTTKNYNGQLTKQHGIHGLWESRIPELLSESFYLPVVPAQLLDRPDKEIWNCVFDSHSLLDRVLLLEDSITAAMPNEKYAFEVRGATAGRTYSEAFTRRYQKAMGNMVEQRMNKAIHLLGSMIYTAWVQAGQPDLSTLKRRKVNKAEKDSLPVPEILIKPRQHE